MGTILKIITEVPNLITLIDYIEKPLINSQKKKKKNQPHILPSKIFKVLTLQ